MLDPKLLEALQAVVECGGFEKAAQRLFLTQSAVSQRIKLLEERLGQPVVTRTSPIDTTVAGRRLLRHFHQLSLMEKDLLDTLQVTRTDSAFTMLAIGVNADSLAGWFLQAVKPFLKRHPVVLDLLMDDQDYTHELMRNGHVAGCVSTRAQAVQGSECRLLGHVRYLCLATPAFRDRFFSSGMTPEALSAAPAILYDRKKDDMHHQFLSGTLGFTGHFPAFALPTPEGFLDYTREGLAYSLQPELMLADDLDTGRLVDLCPGLWMDMPMYWHHWRIESNLISEIEETLVEFALAHLRQP
ncbi:LysR family transcriptional regulator ArgP [Paludibacterium paludis]|uniref:LysR family transcriptional regulator n=1 Tax=Paludibacterium paludis TaxID=1225769 RepID=A0A918P434_9NEIS|nr:LysR family transcriptional regulator ArgP [Paludibacterium paludis]GGY20272.1 LysR family transcriptional regulator [Paludibacterium paludis]